ncbi:MAG: hypothetical protein E7627_06665 [Ruminococcaceae bacterium]|nr:hypothetical protein [Oscillospiraceae bacterium]
MNSKIIITRALALLLVICMAFGMVACGNDTGDKGDKPDNSGETEADEVSLMDLDFNGELFTVHTSINVDEDQQSSYKSSNYLIQGAEEVLGDKASDSALQRNKKVEEDLDIAIRFIESDFGYGTSGSDIRDLIKAGADGINLIINDLGVTRLSAEGLFHDATYGKYFNFDEPYWYDNLMESMSLNTATRFTLAGDYFIDVTRHSHCLLMNKDYYTQLGGNPELIYDLVESGGWTLDALISIINGGEDAYNYLTGEEGYTYSDTYIDNQGNKKKDRRDQWGIAMCGWWGTVIPFLTTSDPGYITRNSDGYPEITVNNERTTQFVDKLTTLYHTKNTAVEFHKDNPDTIDCFVEGRILFLTYQRLGSLESEVFANADLNMAILPYPKLDELQKDYISTIHDTTEVGYIPATMSFGDLEFVSAVVEYLNQMTAEIVMPKYYESTLKIRYARESKNADMIQLIHDSYGNVFPLVWGVPEEQNIFTTGIFQSVFQNDSVFASYYRSSETSALSALEDYITDYEEIRADLESQYAGAGK